MTTIDKANALPNPFLGVNLPPRKPTSRHGYNPVAVQKAIESSNRAGRKISGKEARAIHSLLKGR